MFLHKETEMLQPYHEYVIVNLTTETGIYNFSIDNIDDILIIINSTK